MIAAQKQLHRIFIGRFSAIAGKFGLLKFAVLLAFLFALGSVSASAQTALDFSDTTPTLVSGTDLTQGAVYRFQNVAPGTDALVTLTTIAANTTLVTLDNPATFPNRFQPVILTRTANAVGYVRFDFQLVKAGTSTPRAVPAVYISAQDIDGTTGTNREFVEFVGMQTAFVAPTTKLITKTPIVTGGVSYVQQTPGENQAGIGTDNQFEFYGTLSNTATSFTIIGGNIVGPQNCTAATGGNTCDRLNSYTFDPPPSNVTVAPDVSITKTGPATVAQGGTVAYTLVAKNNGPTTAHGSTVNDTPPAALTNVSITCAAASGAVCPSTTGLTTLEDVFIPTFPSGGQLTFTVTGTAPSSGSFTNVATIAQPNGSTDPTTTNNTSATVTTNVLVPDLQIAKSHTGNFVRGSTGTYTLTVSNSGSVTTNGTITVVDTLPIGMTVNTGLVGSVTPGGANAANWTCNSNATTPQRITCTSTTAIAAAGSSVFTLSVDVAVTTNDSVTNSVTVSGGGEPASSNGNNSATDATTVVSSFGVSGTIFEDASYAGGAGRSLTSSGGTVRSGARVELYDSTGVLIDSTTTGTNGQYQLNGLLAGNYTVRVVNSTVTSGRTGATSSLIGVQTFRKNAGADDTNRVGGEDPTKVDAGAASLGSTLTSLLTGSTAAQSVSSVTIGSANVTGVDFGYNFDTIVNTNNSGQGSLRQFITNANALSGADTTIFMISDGAAHSGLRSGLTNQLTNGVANISVTSTLPAITDSLTTIDGTTQTANVGNTNSGTFGTGGTVGVDNLSLSTVNRPEVQIVDGGNLAIGLDLQGTSETVRGISIYGFGAATNVDSSGNIRLGANASGALIEQNIVGFTAASFTDPGGTARSGGDNIRSAGADNGILRNNLIAFSAGKGVGLDSNSSGWLVENNEIRGNAIENSNLDGIDLETAGTTNTTVRGNLIYDNEGVGVDSFASNGSNTIVNNTITGNGVGSGTNVETAGVRVYGASNTIDRNKVYANYGAGVMVTSLATANTITRNSIYANGTIVNKSGGAASGQIGIDLLSASDDLKAGTSPYVTVNDSGDGDTGGNGLLNFPVLENAQILNGNLVLTGYARPGSAMEFFIAAPDATGFGEGQTYLVTLTEGSAQDTDATTGTYTSPFNGKTVGTDTTNRFSFSIALPSGVSSGTVLTATATLSGATSEFSNNVTIANAPPVIGLVKSVTPTGTQLPGTDLTYTISFTNTGGQSAVNFILTDPNPADTTLKLNTNTDFKLGSVASTLPSGLTGTVTYSNDGGATYAYTPVSGGGGAASGYDRNITHVRWTFAGSLSQTAPNNTGSVSFIVKIR